ncbi:MAG: hypothetical protein ACXWYT_03380, partial [Actinomycetota bacterium]
EVPGVVIPERVRERLWTAGEDGWREGLAMAVDLIAELRAEALAGIYLMPQLGRFDSAAELVEATRSPIVGRSEPLGAGG